MHATNFFTYDSKNDPTKRNACAKVSFSIFEIKTLKFSTNKLSPPLFSFKGRFD